MPKTGLMPYLQSTASVLGKSIKRNSPTILTSFGVGGLLSTVVLAVRATPKALDLIGDENDRRENLPWDIPEEERTEADWRKHMPVQGPVDLISTAWKPYIPTAIMGTATIACIVGSNSINRRRTAALAGLYSIAKTALDEYQAKVAEVIGEKKEEKIREAIDEDRLKNNPIDVKTVIITGKGKSKCYDVLSGRYFESDIQTLQRVENLFNHQLLTEMFITLNELYDEMGLPPIQLGKSIGWSVNGGLLEFRFDSKLTSDGEPCVVIDHYMAPGYNDF